MDIVAFRLSFCLLVSILEVDALTMAVEARRVRDVSTVRLMLLVPLVVMKMKVRPGVEFNTTNVRPIVPCVRVATLVGLGFRVTVSFLLISFIVAPLFTDGCYWWPGIYLLFNCGAEWGLAG